MTTDLVPQAVIVEARKDAIQMHNTALALVVTNAEQENEAYEMLKAIKSIRKIIEKKRKSITSPINKALTEINATFKPLSTPFDEIDFIVRQKVLTFRREEEEKTRIEQERLDAEAVAEQTRRENIQASHVERGHETHELEEVVPDEVVADVAETTVVSKRWTFEVIASNLVPRQYLTLYNAGVRAAIRNGERKIPGIRIYQEEGLRV